MSGFSYCCTLQSMVCCNVLGCTSMTGMPEAGCLAAATALTTVTGGCYTNGTGTIPLNGGTLHSLGTESTSGGGKNLVQNCSRLKRGCMMSTSKR